MKTIVKVNIKLTLQKGMGWVQNWYLLFMPGSEVKINQDIATSAVSFGLLDIFNTFLFIGYGT